MTINVPQPETPEGLERYVARFAREFLLDIHAERYGRQGQKQHGIDVLARDRRPSGTGRLWAFDAKHYPSTPLEPASLAGWVKMLQGSPHWKDIGTYVVVTTAKPSKSVQDRAKALTKQLGIDVEVWFWEGFAERLVKYCGTGPWLSEQERARLRRAYCEHIRSELKTAGPLYPLVLQLPRAVDLRLENVLVSPRVRIYAATRVASSVSSASAVAGSPGQQGASGNKALPASVTSAPSARQEGTLHEWLRPAEGGRPLLLALAPMGGGKTVTLLYTAAQLAEEALTNEEAPLPLRVRASTLTQARLDDVVGRLRFDGITQLWSDPLTSWVVLIDALDEVAERPLRDVLQEISSVHRRPQVAAVAVTCRMSHLRPQIMPEATRVEIAAWEEREQTAFWNRWSAVHRTSAPSVTDPAMRENPLCCTLLALLEPDLAGGEISRAKLFERLCERLFHQWPEERIEPAQWQSLMPAFETAAFMFLANGGRPLSRQDLETCLRAPVKPGSLLAALSIAEEKLGLIRCTSEEAWEFPLRAITEYLASGALLRKQDVDVLKIAGRPWAGEVARLAIDRCFMSEAGRALELMRSFLKDVHLEDANDASLRRTVVTAQAARDQPHASAPLAELLAKVLCAVLTNEQSTWRRQRVADEVRPIAAADGPAWRRLWPMLVPVVVASGDRADWLAGQGVGNAAFWRERLLEEGAAVRGVAVSKLAAWIDHPGVRELILDEMHDEGCVMEDASRSPAMSAAAVLREIPHGEEERTLLNDVLHGAHWVTAEAAAAALLPGEADAGAVLSRLKEMYSFHRSAPVAYQAIAAHRDTPEGRAWMEQNWPEALTMKSASAWPRPGALEGDASSPPPSFAVQRDLVGVMVEAFNQPEVKKVHACLPSHLRGMLMEAACATAERHPDTVIDLLGAEEFRYVGPEAQQALGRAALRSPQLAQMLLARWSAHVEKGRHNLFPGHALEPLAARGDPEAVRVYAAWLSTSFAIYGPPLTKEILRQTPVRDGVRLRAKELWQETIHGHRNERGELSKLAPGALATWLEYVWPVWQEEREIVEGLIAFAQDPDSEMFDVAVSVWGEGEMPPEVARSLQRRLRHKESWPIDEPFFEDRLSRWLQAASQGGILKKVEHTLCWLALHPRVSALLRHRVTSCLIKIRPKDASGLVHYAADKWPFFSSGHWQLSPEHEERLLAASPEAWCEAGLDWFAQHGRIFAVAFLEMVQRLWNRITDGELRSEMVAAVRELAQCKVGWMNPDLHRSFRISEVAEELLFVMGEAAPAMHHALSEEGDGGQEQS